MANTIVVLSICAWLIVSGRRILVRIENPVRAGTLIGLQLVAALLLVAILIQPVFRFTLFTPPPTSVPVLIDLSSSMRLFDTDSILRSLGGHVPAKKGMRGRAPFVFYGFGDSLRELRDIRTVPFNDSKSRFPHTPALTRLRTSNTVILLSDGNWLNPIRESSFLNGKECFYIPLRQKRHLPFLAGEFVDKNPSFLMGKDTMVDLHLKGYNPTGSSVTIVKTFDKKEGAETIIAADTGFFDTMIPIAIPLHKDGFHRLKITIAYSDKSADAETQLLYTILKDRINALLTGDRQSLDRRFISLAIRGKKQWEILDTVGKSATLSPDIILFFDWEATQSVHISEKYPDALHAFIGCMPCTTMSLRPSSRWRLEASSQFEYILQPLRIGDLPPVDRYLYCSRSAWPQNIQPWAWIEPTSSREDSATAHQPALPVLFETRHRGKYAFIAAIKGLWRWDFDIQLSNSIQSGPFSDVLLSLLQRAVEKNIGSFLQFFPENIPVYEQDTSFFRVYPPAYLQDGRATRLSLEFIGLDGQEKTPIRKEEARFYPSQSYVLPVSLLENGRYRCRLSLQTDDETFTAVDTIRVVPYNAENAVFHQNRPILEALGSPLTGTDALETLVARNRHGATSALSATNSIVVRIERSWLLFLGAVLFLITPWILLRLWKID